MGKMIRVSPETDTQIEHLKSVLKISKQDVVKKAIDKLDRELLLQQTNQAFKRLRKDKKAWAEELAERALWEGSDNWDFGDE